MHMPTLPAIEDAARSVYAAMSPTPQYAWPLLARRAGCEVWVKHENHTPTGAFKVRGGIVHLKRRQQRGRREQNTLQGGERKDAQPRHQDARIDLLQPPGDDTRRQHVPGQFARAAAGRGVGVGEGGGASRRAQGAGPLAVFVF